MKPWPGASGPTLTPWGSASEMGQSWLTVVGVVGDVKFTSLTKDAELEFYELYRQASIADMILTVRTVTDPQRLAPALRQAVLETDPTQPISRITPMAQYVSDAVGTPRLSALLLAAFGTTALLLAAVGIYGVISFSVTRRTREIGVRIALGAAGRDVMRTVVGQAVALASVGIAIGIGSALALNSIMQRNVVRCHRNRAIRLPRRLGVADCHRGSGGLCSRTASYANRSVCRLAVRITPTLRSGRAFNAFSISN